MAVLVAFLIVLLPLAALWWLLVEKAGTRETGQPERRGSASGLMGAGLLELQNVLEPERKVEVLREQQQKRDLLVEVDPEGDPRVTGKQPATRRG